MPRPCVVCHKDTRLCICLSEERCDGCKMRKSKCLCHMKPKPKRKWF